MKFIYSILFPFKKPNYYFILLLLSLNLFIPRTYPKAFQSYSDIIHYDCLHYPVVHRKGMAVTQNSLATEVGISLLKKGGNAIDAAVGVGFALAVTLPRAGNIGGGGLMLIHLHQLQRTIAIDYMMQTPESITEDWVPKANQKFSYKGVAVPGTVAGLWYAHQKFGSLPWKQIIEPAIQLAKHGFRLTDDDAQAFLQRKSVLMRDSEAARIFFKKNGVPYQTGDVFKQPDLALSLQKIQTQGKDAFYRGALADKITQSMKAHEGFITKKDLASYHVKATEPYWFNYRGYRIACMPPPSGGVVLGFIMNVLEQFPLKQLKANSAATIRILTETFKLGRYNSHFIGHTLQWNTPKRLTSKQYARSKAQQIKEEGILTPEKIVTSSYGLYDESSDTTHYSVADQYGNVVSNTYTLSDSFGAHVIPPKTGILLNNSMRLLFHQNNSIRKKSRKPGAMHRITSSMTPILVFKNSKIWLATGSLGGRYIPDVIAQLLVNLIDHSLNLAEATMQPRIHPKESPEPFLEVEKTVSSDTIDQLEQQGYRVQHAKAMGNTQSILIQGSLLHGAADSRRPGSTVKGFD